VSGSDIDPLDHRDEGLRDPSAHPEQEPINDGAERSAHMPVERLQTDRRTRRLPAVEGVERHAEQKVPARHLPDRTAEDDHD